MENLEGTCGASLGWGRAEGQKKKEERGKEKGIGLFDNTFGLWGGIQIQSTRCTVALLILRFSLYWSDSL